MPPVVVKPLNSSKPSRSIPATALAQFQPVRQPRTFEQVCARLRAHLAEGGLRPGDKLPAENELAERLGVARNALREALRTLESAGVLERRKGVQGGTFVSAGDTTRMDGVLRDLLSVGSITVEAMAEARVHVLDLVVRLACERAGEEDFAALEANIETTRRMTETGRFLERVECSREFYCLLGRATRNPVLEMMLHSLTEILMQFVQARVAGGGAPHPRLVATRKSIVAALRAGDAERASVLMRKHLEAVHRILADSLGPAGLARARLPLPKQP